MKKKILVTGGNGRFAKILNEKLRKTCYNYKPDVIMLGHADLINSEHQLLIRKGSPINSTLLMILQTLN